VSVGVGPMRHTHCVEEQAMSVEESAAEAMDTLMDGGQATFKFENKGDSVSGVVVSLVRRQDSDDDGLKTWNDGTPKWVYLVGLQTELSEDEDDDGVRIVYARAYCQTAIRDALRKGGLGRDSTPIGGELTITYTSQDKPKQRGHTGAKRFEASF